MIASNTILYVGNKLAGQGKPPTTIDTLAPLLENEGFKVITTSDKKNKVCRLLEMIGVFLKNKHKTDVVLIDTYSTLNFYYAVVIGYLCRIYKVPYIPILHGGDLPSRLERNPKFSKRFFNNSRVNISPSLYLIEEFKNRAIQNLVYIPNSVELKQYPFRLRKKLRPKLLWVRSFAEIYNPLLALQVVEELLNRGYDVEMCMVGPEKDGTLARCKKIAEDLRLPISFPGLLQKQQWINLSAEYDIFINTTNFDNMPVSVVEAMALGFPVVSTHVGGIPYLIKNNQEGILVPPNNPAVFCEAIETLMDSPSLAEAVSNNARTKASQFSWDELREIWKEILQF